jgi:hypothetical protein
MSARADPRGGRSAMVVPTATSLQPDQAVENDSDAHQAPHECSQADAAFGPKAAERNPLSVHAGTGLRKTVCTKSDRLSGSTR